MSWWSRKELGEHFNRKRDFAEKFIVLEKGKVLGSWSKLILKPAAKCKRYFNVTFAFLQLEKTILNHQKEPIISRCQKSVGVVAKGSSANRHFSMTNLIWLDNAKHLAGFIF